MKQSSYRHTQSCHTKLHDTERCQIHPRHTDQPTRSYVLNTWTAATSVLLLAPVLLLTPAFIQADQTGGTVVSGSGSINQTSKLTTINQSSQTLGLTWDTFNINADQTVNFVQPNAKALAVNRIFDTNGSRIMGNLNANGQVWLINPNGVFFGAGSQINVGSILASTLNPLGDPNDLNNSGDINQVFSSGSSDGSAGSVINQGTITAANGGYVAMLGNKVINEGVITAKLGTVALGAGSQVSLQFNDNKLLKLTVDQSTLDNLAENKQLIKADGGLVLMSAGAKESLLASTVNNSGVIEAHTVENKDGKIILMGGMAAGTTYVAGTLDASASSSDNTGTADGGFIETSAAHVKITDGTVVTTHAEKGETGTWLIDPTNFNIEAGNGASTTSSIGATTLSSNLASNNVKIETVATGSEAGDINVNAAVSWSSNNNLTLSAHNDININQDITATGATAKLSLEYGQANVAAGNTSSYNVNAKVNLQAGDNFSTKLGSDGTTTEYKVITDLGAEGSTTGTDLQGINGNLAGNYVLGADIDANSTNTWNADAGFNPLGSSPPFTGLFDGLNHTINGLTINRSTTNYVGLFGYTDGATIRNVGMVGSSVTGNNYVGGLVGFNDNSTVSNSYATGSVTGNDKYVGGLVGYNDNSTISNSYATGSVTGNDKYVGGLVGYNDNSTISNSYATGNVTGSDDYVGGLVSINRSSTVSNSYATGNVTGNNYVGGLVGYNFNGSTVSNSYATGVVTGTGNVGGLVGLNSSTITNSYYADTTGQSDTGKGEKKTIAELAAALPTGFDSSVWGNGDNQTTPYLLSHAGFDSAGPVYLGTDATAATPYQAIININQLQAINNALSANYVLGTDIDASSTSTWNAGAGFNPLGDNSTRYTGIFNGLNHTINGLTINRSSTHYVGLFGYTDGATISNVGMVGGSLTGYQFVGGLVGESANSTVSNSYATGNVTGDYYVGGLVGYNYLGSSVSNSYATGNVIGEDDYIGGLVGYNHNNNSTVSNSYATGNVTGDDRVGGLVGNNSSSGSISNSYATGVVMGDDYVGGLVGRNGGTISNSYYADTTGQSDTGKGEKKTIAELAAALPTGFDSSVWGNGDNQTTPYLLSHAGFDSAGPVYLGTDATATTPYQAIININQLQAINNALSANYVLGTDIDASSTSSWNSGAGFNPLGDDSTHFTGIFNGLNHTVNGLIINRPSTDYVGLFGYTDGATISNVGMVSGSVTGNQLAGGLVGYNTNSSISNSYATGNVTGSDDFVGGLVGYNDNSTISNSYATGNVTSSDDYVGGLVGINRSSTVSNSYATGNVTGNNYVGGLVGYNFSSSTVSNSYATGVVNGTFFVGGLVGYNNSTTISNSYATGEVNGTFAVGGLVGANDDSSSINNSYATGVVTGASYVGGLVGVNEDSTVSNSYATGSVTGTSDVGGLVGDNRSTISNSYYADTTGQSDTGKGEKKTIAELAAALPTGFDSSVWGNGDNQTTPYLLSHAGFDSAGPVYLGTDATATTPYQAIININQLQAINNALSANYVLGTDIDASSTSTWNTDAGFNPLGDSSTRFTGIFNGLNHTINGLTINRPSTHYVGLFGYTDGATISNVGMVGGSVMGDSNVGGLVGKNENSTVSNSYATGDVTGDYRVGGLVGFNDNSTVSNSYATGNVTGDIRVGGLVGDNDDSSISNSYAIGNVTSNYNVGGLVGYNFNSSTVSNSYATGNVKGNDNRVGGLVGWNFSSSTVSNSYATGNVMGNDSIGGLVGNNTSSTVSNSYATGTVSGSSSIGGLVGYYNNGSVSNSYATGLVTGASDVGGLVGRSFSTVTNSYYADTTGQSDTGKGERKTTAEMQSLSTFTGPGWNIDDAGGTGKIWRIYQGHTSPLLRSFMTQLDLTGTNTAVTYNGKTQSITLPTGTDTSLVQGTLANGKDAGTYNNRDIYSGQQGYDITGSPTLTINKATLTYNATPTSIAAGTTPTLTGNISGFVAGESIASATTGNLGWNTAGNTTQPGSYDITGSGLAAPNYDFVQNSSNATALTVNDGSIPDAIETTSNSLVPTNVPTVTQTQVNMVNVNNSNTAAGDDGRKSNNKGGFINDPQSQMTTIDVVYISCDDKDEGCS